MKKLEEETEELYITCEGIDYLVSINHKSREIWYSEIDSFDYLGTGRLRLKNPAFEMKYKKETLEFIKSRVPKNQQLNIVNSIQKELRKPSPKNQKTKLKNPGRGRSKSVELINMTFWTIENKTFEEKYADVNRRAYRKFEVENIKEVDFGTMINRERRAIQKAFTEWKRREQEFYEKDEAIFPIFKKEYLRRYINY